MPTERIIWPAARPHTCWSRSKPTRDFLLGCAVIAAVAWGWAAWRGAERAECAAAVARGTVETASPVGERAVRVAIKGGTAVEIPVETGRPVPRVGCRGRVCENGHWHAELPGEDF